MKKVIVVCLFVMVFNMLAFGEVSQDPEKFQITYKVTYNAITLGEAEKIEMQIKKNHRDACNVRIDVDDTTTDYGSIITFGSN